MRLTTTTSASGKTKYPTIILEDGTEIKFQSKVQRQSIVNVIENPTNYEITEGKQKKHWYTYVVSNQGLIDKVQLTRTNHQVIKGIIENAKQTTENQTTQQPQQHNVTSIEIQQPEVDGAITLYSERTEGKQQETNAICDYIERSSDVHGSDAVQLLQRAHQELQTIPEPFRQVYESMLEVKVGQQQVAVEQYLLAEQMHKIDEHQQRIREGINEFKADQQRTRAGINELQNPSEESERQRRANLRKRIAAKKAEIAQRDKMEHS